MICKICNNSEGNKTFYIKEMMMGTGETFPYFECPKCGCLQISQIPGNIAGYYPENYYSFHSPATLKYNLIKKYMKMKRDLYAIYQTGIVGRLISLFKPPAQDLIALKKCNIGLESNILDVGCGNGRLLLDLSQSGFKNLTGIDPFIKNDIGYDGVRVLKKEISALDGQYDVIMMHHSFEHMPEPLQVLKNICRLSNKNTRVLIRIPIVSSYAWKHYGVNWAQIDAPRHFFLHSLKSMEVLSDMAGLGIKKIVYDSTEFQFWASEQYQKGIPLTAGNSYRINPGKSIFTIKQIKGFRKKSLNLNKNNLGDQAAFYLEKH